MIQVIGLIVLANSFFYNLNVSQTTETYLNTRTHTHTHNLFTEELLKIFGQRDLTEVTMS